MPIVGSVDEPFLRYSRMNRIAASAVGLTTSSAIVVSSAIAGASFYNCLGSVCAGQYHAQFIAPAIYVTRNRGLYMLKPGKFNAHVGAMNICRQRVNSLDLNA